MRTRIVCQERKEQICMLCPHSGNSWIRHCIGDVCSNFAVLFGIIKLESQAYHVAFLYDPVFSHFDTILMYDRQTDRQTETYDNADTVLR